MHSLWQKEEKSVQIFIPYKRPFSLVFWEEEWLVGATPSTWNFGSTGHRWIEIADFEPIFARSTSAITPSEKSSIDTNRKSTTCFPMSLRWLLYITTKPPKGAQNATSCFRCKIALRLKKVCYKVSLCENCQQQSCKAFIGLIIHAKMIGGATPTWNFGWNWMHWSEIADFLFSLLAPQPSHLAKEVQLTLIGSPLCALQWAQDEHHMLSLSPPKGGLKNARCPKFEQ